MVWSGAVDANFGNPLNWIGTLLNDGTVNAQFPSTLTVAPVVNTNFSINSLTYASGVPTFTLANSGGAGLTIQSSLSLLSGAQTISAPLTLGSAFTFSGPGGQAFLTLSGGLTAASGFTANNGMYLTVSGPWSVSGTTTLQSGAVLEFTGGSRTITHNIVNNGSALAFNASGASTTTVNGVISGSGIVNYFSPVTLNAANIYTGQSTIAHNVTIGVTNALPTSGAVFFSGSNARLNVNENQTLGTLYSAGGFGNVTLASGRTLTLGAGQNNTYTGTIGGAGALTLSGGAHTFTGALTHTGGTTVTAGQMYLGNGGTTGSIAGNVTVASGANFGFNRSDAFTFNGVVSGGGDFLKDGTGTLTIANVQSYGGATALFGGTLQLGANAVLPASTTVSFASGPAVTFDLNNFHQVVASISSGAGNTNGSILLGSGNLTIGRSGSPDGFDGVISGTGGLIKNGSNTQSLGNANTYSGGTSINGGTLIVTNTTGSGLGSGAVAVAAGGTLQIGTGGTGGFVSGNISNLGAVVVNRNDGIVYGATMSGAGTLSKLGAGTLTLTGANTFTGGTTINLGTIAIGNGGTTGSLAGNVNFTGPGELQFNRTDAVTFSGNITGPGRVKLLTGTLTLSGTNTYSGNTFVTAGTLIAGAANAFSPNSTFRVNSGGQVQVGANQTIGGLEDYTTGVSGNVTITAGSALTLNRADGAGIVYSGVISGAGALIVTGTGPQVLAGANTYSGGTIINGGSIRLGANNALPVGGNVTIGSTPSTAGTLDLFNRTQTIGALTFNGVSSSVGGSVSLGSGTLTLGGSVIFDGSNSPHGATISGGTLVLGGNRTFNIGDSSSTSSELTLSSAISGAGNTLTKIGAGTLVLSGTSNHAATIISNGQLRVVASGALPSAGNVTIIGSSDTFGSSLELGNVTQSIGALTLGGANSTSNAAVFIASGGTLTLGGNVTFDAANSPFGANISGGTLALAGTRTFDIGHTPNAFTDLTISSVISGSGAGLTKTGAGFLMLTGVNTYTGTTTINGGHLMIGPGGSLATTPVVVNSTTPGLNASLEIMNSTSIGALTFGGAGAVSGVTNSVFVSSGTLTLTGGVVYDATNNPLGAVLSGFDVALGSTQVFNVGNSSAALNDLTVSAGLSGAGGITKTGAGTLLLTNSSSVFSGPVSIQAGTLTVTSLNNIGADSALGTGTAGGGTIAIGSGATGATLRFSGFGSATTNRPLDLAGTTGGATLDVATDSGSVRFTGPVTASGAGAKTLTLTGTSTVGGEIAGIISDNSPTNRTALLKTGTGTWTLSGANTYTGGTTVSGGTLVLGASNTLPAAGNVVIRATSGQAILSLGNVTQTIGALTFGGSGGSTFASNYLLLGSGTLTLGGDVTYDTTNSPASGVIAGVHPFTGGYPFGGTLALGSATRTFNIGDSSATPLDFILYSNVTGGAGVDLVKTGSGNLTLAGQSTYLGNTTIAAGTLYLASSTIVDGSIISGPVGRGTLVLQSGTTLAPGGAPTSFSSFDGDDVTIHNSVSLANNVTLGAHGLHQGLAFTGTVSAATATTTLHLRSEEPVSFNGTITAPSAGTAIVFDSAGQSALARALIAGSIGPNIASLTADHAALVFGSPASLAHAASINVANNGYVGVGYGGGAAPSPAALVARIANPATFTGTLGFDTDIENVGVPYVFTGTLDYSAFGAGLTLGSISAAVLDGTLIPASNGYQFGNGGGLLFVRSPLTDIGGSRSVAVSSNGTIPGNALMVALQGTNTFTGNLSITHSLALLDSIGALPATATIHLGANGYVGATELARASPTVPLTFSTLIGRLGSYTPTSVVGLDSTVFVNALGQTGGRIVTDTLDLTSLSSIYLGSATRTLLLGPILAPNQGGANRTLALIGAGRGHLAVGSLLVPGNVSRVMVGTADVPLAHGTVELLGANTYTGGTTLLGGTLLLGRSSQASAGTIVNGPLGTGALTVAGNALAPVLASSDPDGNDLVLHNAFVLGSALQLGTQPFEDGGSTATALRFDGYPQLILNGLISDLDATNRGSLTIYTDTVLNGANTYSGGTTVFAGALTLGHNSALGTGSLALTRNNDNGQSISLNVAGGARTIANPIVLNLFNDSYLPITGNGSLTLNGTLTLNSGVTLAPAVHPLYVNGAISGSGRVRIETTSLVFLGGTNTYTGGTQVDLGGLVFGSAGSIPTGFGQLTVDYAGYLGIGTPPGNLQSDFLDRFNKGATAGTIGFDTPGGGNPNVFSGSINLGGFDSSARLGSATTAVLSGTITPRDSQYNFGGGGGLLQVTSALTDGAFARSLYVNSLDFAPLTLRLSGANSFTGGITVLSSGLIFDHAALPSSAGSVFASTGSYVGTTSTGITPNAFLALLNPSLTQAIIGFDSFTGTPYTVASGTTIDLASAFTPSFDPQLMLGTATQAVINGPIALPAAQTNYRFAGYKGGQLTIGSILSGARGVEIGDANNAATFGTPTTPTAPRSGVTLSGANTYTGGTFLNAGLLYLGHDQALGTGTLTVADNDLNGARLGLFAAGGARSIANAITLGSDLDIGGANHLTLTGAISGNGELYKLGTGTLTLSGSNSFSGGIYIAQGTVAFGSATAAGTGPLRLGTAAGPTALFQVSSFINGISANHVSDVIQLASGVTLTVNQGFDADFLGAITGGGSVVYRGPQPSEPHELRLGGASTYTGSTTINGGVTIIAANNQAFGVSSAPTSGVVLNGGNLVVNTGITVGNDLTIASGTLGGGGTLQPGSTGVALSSGAIVSPGMNTVGTFTFDGTRLASGAVLTLSSGGVYNWQLMDALAISGGWDVINVNGTAAITSTAAQPFTLNIQPVTSLDLISVSVLANFNPAQAYSWSVLNAASITGFTPGSLLVDWSAISGQAAGGSFSLSLNGTNTSLMLNFTPIPEPSTYAMLAAGAAAIVGVVRRRRR